jgi:PNKP (polynucleotide 5'-kinase/3'-phosphatase) family adenylyltransferase-like protein
LNCLAVGDFSKLPRCYKAISVTDLLSTAGFRLNRFVAREPLRRVQECVFAVLALESEPIDARL